MIVNSTLLPIYDIKYEYHIISEAKIGIFLQENK